MIRLTWMQFRVHALVALGALVIVAIVLGVTGPHLARLYDITVVNCAAHRDCSTAASALTRTDSSLQAVLNVLVEVAPALIGLFWGAPLVARELETGTYRLAWTQVTRARWVAIKLGLLGLAGMLVGGILSLMVTWWSSPLDTVRMTPFSSFDQRDLVPVGYAAFAFVLGVTAGVLIRRTLPAMAAALAGFVVARVVVAHFGRPYLVSPLKITIPDSTIAATGTSPASAGAPNPRDWVISEQTINAKGQVIGQFGSIGNGTAPVGVTRHGGVVLGGGYSCPGLAMPHKPSPSSSETFHALIQKCVDQLHIREVLVYHPIGHYWALQWTELGAFLGAAIALSAFCLWWVRCRLV
ncbi:MAG: ABC transporter permease [Acidimicrobiales bacterium]